MKTDIKNREDVSLLINTFYKKIRKDEILGPIFNGIITDWDAHLVLLTDVSFFSNRTVDPFGECPVRFITYGKSKPVSALISKIKDEFSLQSSV